MDIVVKHVVSDDELQKVFAIRRVVFVDEQNCPPELEWENEDVSVHFLATADDVPCGACRWRKTDGGYKLERFAVLKAYRGKGVGQALVRNILEALPENASPVYLNAQLDAMPLYSKFGFKPVGNEFKEAGIRHYKMVKEN